jgi:hypothetical protein
VPSTVSSQIPPHVVIDHCYSSLKSCHHRIPQLRRTPCPVHRNLCNKTITSALQLEVHLQVVEGAPQQCPQQLSHAWSGHWTNLLHLSTEYYLKWDCLQCVSVSHSQDCVHRGLSVCLNTEERSISNSTDKLIIMKFSEDPQLGYHLHSHSTTYYDICIGWYLYSPWVTWIRVCSTAHADPIYKTHWHLLSSVWHPPW